MREETSRRIMEALEKHERTRLSGFFEFKYTRKIKFPYILVQEDFIEILQNIIREEEYDLPSSIRYSSPGKTSFLPVYNDLIYLLQEHISLSPCGGRRTS